MNTTHATIVAAITANLSRTFRGSYTTRPGDACATVVIAWESYWDGRGWRVDLFVNGHEWESHVDPDDVVRSLSVRPGIGPAVARRVDAKIRATR